MLEQVGLSLCQPLSSSIAAQGVGRGLGVQWDNLPSHLGQKESGEERCSQSSGRATSKGVSVSVAALPLAGALSDVN